MAIEYEAEAELPSVEITWRDSAGNLIDFSTGWTFTARVGQTGQAAAVTKTTGITGAATAPNIVIAWSPAELDGLAPGTYSLRVLARQTATNKDRTQSTTLTIVPAVGP